MLLSSQKKIRLGYIIAFLLLLFSCSLLFYSTTQVRVHILIIISLVTAVLAIVYSLLLYNHENKKANEYHGKLEEKIRQLKATNEGLKELRSLEKFAATGRVARTIAHEVRNPLTNISLAGEQLKELSIQNPESSVLLEMIHRNTVRINQLIANCLTLQNPSI